MLGTDSDLMPEDPTFGILSRAVCAGFRDLFGDRFSLRELSKEVLASAPNRLTRFISGARNMTFDEGSRLLAHTGTDPALFLELVLAHLPKPSPAAVMRQLCLLQESEKDPFLVELEGFLALPNSSEMDPGSRIEELKSLEDLRFTGASTAQMRTEVICRELASVLGGPAGERVRRELSLAIGLWAAIARTMGRKQVSGHAFAIAFELISAPLDCEAEALLRCRASYLLFDMGYASFGFSFLDSASEHFMITNNRTKHGTCLVDRAIALIMRGDNDKAATALRTSIELLPSEEWRYRAAAFHALSICAEHRKEFGAAKAFLENAIQEYGSRRAASCGQFYRAQGRHAINEGRLAEASVKFRKAAEILGDLGGPFEGLLALIDVSEIAIKRQDRTELGQLGHEFLLQVPKNSHSRIAKETLIRLADSLLWGTLDECQTVLENSRTKLQQAAKDYLLPAFVHS